MIHFSFASYSRGKQQNLNYFNFLIIYCFQYPQFFNYPFPLVFIVVAKFLTVYYISYWARYHYQKESNSYRVSFTDTENNNEIITVHPPPSTDHPVTTQPDFIDLNEMLTFNENFYFVSSLGNQFGKFYFYWPLLTKVYYQFNNVIVLSTFFFFFHRKILCSQRNFSNVDMWNIFVNKTNIVYYYVFILFSYIKMELLCK